MNDDWSVNSSNSNDGGEMTMFDGYQHERQ